MGARRRSWRSRGIGLLLTVTLTAPVLALACSEPTRQRVLNFFFDGVPKPGEVKTKGYAPMGSTATSPMAQAVAERARAERLMYTHAPYRENRCDACHNINTGLLFKTAQQGLCKSCHSDVPGPAPFVHGPVALGDCLVCHHPHGSAYPNILVREPTQLCLECHEQSHLSDAPYHSVSATQGCSECHGAHAGNERFFLKQGYDIGALGEPALQQTPSVGPESHPASQPAPEDR